MPPLSPEEFSALKADIAKRGVLVPVEVDADTGEVLDGHHRLQACEELGLPRPATVARRFASEGERTEHAIVLNLVRRQLGPVSWAQAFERLLEARGVERGQGSAASKRHSQSATVADIASEVGVPERTARWRMRVADALTDHPELAARVDGGELPVRKAVRQARGQVSKTFSQPDALPAGPFSVVYADPPWRYADAEPSRAVENHYPTMSLEEIKALNVQAGEDAVLFLWATSPKLAEALAVLSAWGFEYRTCAVWVKDSLRLHRLRLCPEPGLPPAPVSRASAGLARPQP